MLDFAVTLLSLITLFLLAGVVPSPGGEQGAVFRTSVFVLLLGVLAVGSVWACRRRRPAFILTHLGCAVVLWGAFLGLLWTKQGSLTLPVTAHHGADGLRSSAGKTAPFGFRVSATRFDVAFYPPQYRLLHAAPGQPDWMPTEDELRRARLIDVPDSGEIGLGDAGRVRVDELRAGADAWVPVHRMDSGWLLWLEPAVPRRYEADLEFLSKDGAREMRTIRVNQPATRQGWRFYLTSYDGNARRFVVVTARRDPGRPWVVAGIWMVIAGVAWTCWGKGAVRSHADD
jgi:cytochrome c biogenesis protein ResB